MEPFLCEDCGDLIGVYEPLVVRNRDGMRITSRAAEPELRAAARAYSHHDCSATHEAAQAPARRAASGR
jgi:hypothetical protein